MPNPFVNTDRVNAIIRVRRGPEIDRTQTIYDSGELVFSTDKKRLFVGDSADNGETGEYGGIIVGNKNWITNNFEKLSGILPYDTVYRTDTSKFYLLTGGDYLRPDNYLLINTVNQSGGGTFTLPVATSTNLGGVIIKDGLVVSNGYLRVDVDNNTIKIDPATKKIYAVGGNGGGGSVNIASENTFGIVKVPLDGGVKVSSGNLSVNVDNSTIKLTATPTGSKLYVDGSLVKIPTATSSTLGVVRTGRGLSASNIGTLNLNIASYTDLGGVKVGAGFTIDPNDGELTVDGTYFDSTPIGSIHWFAMSAAPTGFLECSGGILPINDYTDLYSAIGTTYNDGLSTQYYNSSDVLTGFKVPDLRGEFIRGWDDGRGVDSNRTFGSNQLDALQNHQHTLSGNTGQEYFTINDYNTNPSDSGSFMSQGPDLANDAQFNPYTGPILGSGTFPATSSVRVESETRPRNVALLPCIKALKTVNNIVVPTGDYIPKPFIATHTDILVYDDEYGTGGTWVSAPSSTYAGEALLSANGYQKLPSGLIMQWGMLSAVSLDQTFHLVTLPTQFPNLIFNVTATISYDPAVSGSIGTVVKGLSTTGFYIMGDNSTSTTTGNIFWQAFGY
jgi:microcystin-dependent protein